MHNEKIFTPEHVTNIMFEELEYKGDKIRKKHIIDNSCGNGAILKMIVRTYINVCIMCGLSKEETIDELETYIHGIEIDENLYKDTIDNLNKIAEEYSLCNVKWDIVCGDSMEIHTYDNKMDYVIGNPPYCNIHDISEEKRESVKQYKFANGGMTDMYLVFFEIGINMLNENGKLAYITANSWLNSVAGTNFRNYLKETKTLLEIYQYGHYKVFDKVNTYTCITILSKASKTNNLFVCYRNTSDTELNFVHSMENLDECMLDGKIYLTDKNTLKVLTEINNLNQIAKNNKNRIRVKNGFATLKDKFFIIDDYNDKSDKNVLKVFKASNEEEHYFFYPYDKEGNPMELSEMNPNLVDFMLHKASNMEIDTTTPYWYLYGRTQALKDVKYDKIIINNLIRDVNDIKMDLHFNISFQQGVYSGYYIPLYESQKTILLSLFRKIKTNEFIQYVKAIGKYKNGGYYSFSTKDLEAWLNYKIK